MKKLLVWLSILVVLVFVGLFVNNLKQPQLILSEASYPISGYLVDGKFFPSQQTNKLKLSPGEHSVQLVGPLLSNSSELVKLSYFKKINYKAEPRVTTKEAIAKKLASNVLAAGYGTIGNIRMTEDKQWLVYFLLPVDAQGDGETEIHNFRDGYWVSVAAGTNFETEGLSDNPLPPTVIDLLQNTGGL